MEEWKEYKLGDFMEFNPKISLKKNTVARKITMDQLVPHSRDIYSWTYEPYSGGAKFQNGDTIMARITPCLENGKHAFISLLEENEIAYGSTEYIVIRGRCGISDNRFVYYLTHYPSFKEAAVKSMVGSSGRQRAQVDVLENLTMKLPAIPEQRRIAEALSILDDKIKVNKRINDNFVIDSFCQILLIWMLTTLINDNLEQQSQALFKSWFVDFEPFRDQAFIESELGGIPQGWRVGTLADITKQRSDKVGQQEDVKVLSPVTTGKLMLSEEYFTKQVFSESIAKYKVVEIGDFAYNPARVNIGSIGRNEYDFRGCVSPVYVVFSCKNGYAYYFDLFRKTEKFQTEVKARAIGGVRQSLNYTDFGFIQTVIAPISVMEQFNPFYEKIQVAQKHLEEENSRLSSLRDTLLPRLMSGELKVHDVAL